ncbi:alpha/beta hydrolase [Phenylobacterium deserti]|uniref:Alpha/beta hydrolase n=1 Tax=Phenylobacterium deserti TaxID=1914756 RepID=A0A328ARU2_9CAUL|nr:alpha/beta fold hydrolase [Phenylobacterium deserti]RAK57762.1 alpha/beta hydrolase [Phenylobacterium deserti]
MTKTVMLIHGAWLNSLSWEGWKARFEARGFHVVAPDWPYDEGDPADLRAAPRQALTKIGPKAIVDSYMRQIEALAEPPILIGHSAGGVWVQHLLDRGLGAAGVAIDPAPTPGVALAPHAIVSALPVLGDPFSGGKVKSMTREFFHRRFANGLPEDLKDAHYDRYIVPTAGKVYWDGVLGGAGKIHWDSPVRPPLLLIAGGKDLIADASMTRAIYEHQKRAASVTEFKLYPDRSHWTCLEPGWEAVADFALDWVVEHSVAGRPPVAAGAGRFADAPAPQP